jgi:hypothetical protein
MVSALTFRYCHEHTLGISHQRHAKMANNCADCDRDSAFGDDDDFWTTDPMFSLGTPVAGTKRAADDVIDDAARTRGQSTASQLEHGTQPVDPSLCCTHCPETCDVRSSKRRASALKVAEYHELTTDSHPSLDTDCSFPDDCFEKFCQECNLEPDAPPVPCPADNCSPDNCPEDDACFDPRCTQKDEHCTDDCVDPQCTKAACPEQSCCCQKCNAQSFALPEPHHECHFAHSAPTPIGTVYCYDSAPCHFQEGFHGQDDELASFETYPCFSQTHRYSVIADDLTTIASSAPTPALSHSNYTSLESTLTTEPSPGPGQTLFPPHCYLNVAGDHCHIDNSCCHGAQRACGDAPSASQQQLDLWNSSIASGNGLASNFMNFGFNPSLPTSPVSADRNSLHSNPFSLEAPMLGFNDQSFHDQSWMLTDSAFPNTFQPAGSFNGANKLDFLASAAQSEILRPSATTLAGSSSTSAAGAADAQACVCKWYVGSERFTDFPSYLNTRRSRHCLSIQANLRYAGNMRPTSSASPSSTPPKPSTSTSRPDTWTTAHNASVNGKAAMRTPKTSSNARSYLVTFSATQAIAHMPAAMRDVRRRLPPTKPKTTTRGHIQGRGHMYVTAVAIRQQHIHSCKHTSARCMRARSRTNAGSASLHVPTRVT